jgi:hypothetical protein
MYILCCARVDGILERIESWPEHGARTTSRAEMLEEFWRVGVYIYRAVQFTVYLHSCIIIKLDVEINSNNCHAPIYPCVAQSDRE